MAEHTLSPHEREKRQDAVLDEVLREMTRQDIRWGEQNHSDGTGPTVMPLYDTTRIVDDSMIASRLRDLQRERTDFHAREGRGTWLDILLEETFEALAEDEPAGLRAELLQVAAVATQWVLAIDRRA